MPEKPQQIGRLALRTEGEWWNAYYARQETMDGAIHLGSIRIGAVKTNPKLKAGFMTLMRDMVTGIIETNVGQRPSWGGPEPAPQHERAGSA